MSSVHSSTAPEAAQPSSPFPWPGSTMEPSSSKSHVSIGTIIGVVIGASIGLLIAFLWGRRWGYRLISKLCSRKLPPSSQEQLAPTVPDAELRPETTSIPIFDILPQNQPSDLVPLEVLITKFTYAQLKAATNNFSEENLLGKGGFGSVYKGKILNGQLVAVKQLNIVGRQGEKEFQAEVQTISRVHHRHLVTLLGYCIMRKERLLVYKYVPNFTLKYHLHVKRTKVLSWKIRQRVALGTAKGLAYLHEDCEPRIIHRDIKSANILINNKFEAIVSDFGLAKLTSDEHTHVSTRIMGTIGYLAPEYASSGKVTEKSDIYSFGVVLLELITGQQPVDPSPNGGSLADWARPLLDQVLEERNLELIVDPKLNYNYDEKQMMTMVGAAAACIRYEANRRPKMSMVVRAFEEEALIFDSGEGIIHKQDNVSTSTKIVGTSNNDNSKNIVDTRMFKTGPEVSQDYGSSHLASQSGTQSFEHSINTSLLSTDSQTDKDVERKSRKKSREA